MVVLRQQSEAERMRVNRALSQVRSILASARAPRLPSGTENVLAPCEEAVIGRIAGDVSSHALATGHTVQRLQPSDDSALLTTQHPMPCLRLLDLFLELNMHDYTHIIEQHAIG
jgi:hypothetical protein